MPGAEVINLLCVCVSMYTSKIINIKKHPLIFEYNTHNYACKFEILNKTLTTEV